MSASETAVIFGVMPFVGFLVRPLFGALADKLHRHKLMLVVCCLLGSLFMCLILVVQPAPAAVHHGKPAEISVECSPTGAELKFCAASQRAENYCGITGHSFQDVVLGSHGIVHTSEVVLLNQNSSLGDYVTVETPKEFTTASKCSQVMCRLGAQQNGTKICFSSWEHGTLVRDSCINPQVGMEFDLIMSSLKYNYMAKYEHPVWNVPYQCHGYSFGLVHREQTNEALTCSANVTLSCLSLCEQDLYQRCPDYDQKTALPKKTHTQLSATFWQFFILYMLANIALSPILPLNDAITYDILGEEGRSRWGFQRLWGTIGFGIFAVVSGFAMDMYVAKTHHMYAASFYIYGILNVISAVVGWQFTISDNIHCNALLKNVGQLVKNFEIVGFLVVMFIFGSYFGVNESFLFWHLQELGAPQTLLGISLATTCIIEVPMLAVSGYIINRIGHVTCIYLCFVAYVVRFLGYSFLGNPWFCILVDLTHGLTFALMWSAATQYASIITPPGMSATLQGLLSGIHFGFGKLA